MSDSLKTELLLAHIYDMSLVARLTDQINTVFNQLDIRFDRRPLTSPKLVSLLSYWVLCRLVHPSRRTLGEELVGLYPGDVSRRYSSIARIRWIGAQLSTYILFWGLLPLLKGRYDRSGLYEVVEAITVSISDIWYVFSPNPTGMSVLEEKLRPGNIFPTVSCDQPRLHIPGYIYKLAGITTFAKSAQAMYRACVEYIGTKPVLSASVEEALVVPASDVSSAFDACIVCMGSIETPTALICGHVLCWSCALSWTTSKVDGVGCPTCRTPCKPQDLVPLVHYAPSGSDWTPLWKKAITIR